MIISTPSLNLCETTASNIMKYEERYGRSCLNLYDILQNLISVLSGTTQHKQILSMFSFWRWQRAL